MKIPTKLAYQYMAVFFNFSTTSNHLHPLQVETAIRGLWWMKMTMLNSGLKGLNNKQDVIIFKYCRCI